MVAFFIYLKFIKDIKIRRKNEKEFYLYLIVIIVLIACSGKEDDKKETIQIMQYCILCKILHIRRI
jgi:hypothetical protein